jgi:septal ring factor EnvC (AmiA/AmiB activator)
MNFRLTYLQNIRKAISSPLLVLLFVFSGVNAQKANRETLEQQRKNTQKQIETTKKILKETQSQKAKSVAVLRTLQAQINLRKRMVSQLGRQLTNIEEELLTQNTEILTLTSEIAQMKVQYTHLIYNGYKANNARSRLQFIFSSNDFNQAIKRMRYLKKLVEFRKKQLEIIKQKIEEKVNRVHRLMETKNEKLLVLTNRETEKKDLEDDETEASGLYSELRKQEKDLVKDLREKEALAQKLDDAIKKAIEAEIKKAKAEEEKRKRVEAERRKKEADEKARLEKEANAGKETTAPPKTPEPKESFISDEQVALSKQFNLNRNKLPWPVGGGFVSQAFGRHPHPTLINITTENNGINISTTKGTQAKAVFEGEVTAILKIPGLFNTVLVKHGDYFTVYSNLEEVFVSKGDVIKTGTELGAIHTNEEGRTELHFEVWKGNEKQNPEAWLRRK